MAIETGKEGEAADILARPYIVYKTANQIVNNSVVLVNITQLLFPIAVDEIWEFTFSIDFLSGAVPDIKLAITIPAAATIKAVGFGNALLVAGNYQMIRASAGTIGYGGSGVGEGANNEIVIIRGVVVNGANAGNVQLQFAQNAADVSNTSIVLGSNLIAFKLL